jgi:hypothetical protein
MSPRIPMTGVAHHRSWGGVGAGNLPSTAHVGDELGRRHIEKVGREWGCRRA